MECACGPVAFLTTAFIDPWRRPGPMLCCIHSSAVAQPRHTRNSSPLYPSNPRTTPTTSSRKTKSPSAPSHPSTAPTPTCTSPDQAAPFCAPSPPSRISSWQVSTLSRPADSALRKMTCVAFLACRVVMASSVLWRMAARRMWGIVLRVGGCCRIITSRGCLDFSGGARYGS